MVADSLHPKIVDTLRDGLDRLSASFPWIAGQVVNEGAGKDSTGVFKIKPLEKAPRLVLKDLRNDPSAPTMDELRRANFPFTMLHESVIAPRNTLPGGSDSPKPDSDPVFIVQANFIAGGLILTFVGQHGTMDMVGQGHIIYLLSKACRNEPFTTDELSTGNIDRRGLFPLFDDSYDPAPGLVRQIAKPAPTTPNLQVPPPPECTWAYFSFTANSLAKLKAVASKSVTTPPGFISTDDALSAFIWQAVARARLPRLNPERKTTFGRAVDARSFMNVSSTYPGVLQNMTYSTCPIQELIEEPLGVVASKLRSVIHPKTCNLERDTRALASLLNRSPNKSIISFTATLDLSVDITLSSWAKVNCYDLDFGLGLGKPESVRRPLFNPVESLLYLMPKALGGEIAAGICLRNEDMEILKMDEEFMKYATYIG